MIFIEFSHREREREGKKKKEKEEFEHGRNPPPPANEANGVLSSGERERENKKERERKQIACSSLFIAFFFFPLNELFVFFFLGESPTERLTPPPPPPPPPPLQLPHGALPFDRFFPGLDPIHFIALVSV